MDITRRDYLVAALGAGVATVSTTLYNATTAEPSPDDALRQRLANASEYIGNLEAENHRQAKEIDRLQSELEQAKATVKSTNATVEEKRQRISELEARIEALETRNGEPSEFSEETVDTALRVGTRARDGVYLLVTPTTFTTAWAISDTQLITAAHSVAEYSEPLCYANDESQIGVTVVDAVLEGGVDMALLEVTDDAALNPLPTGDVSELSDGTPLVQVGHPTSLPPWTISLGSYQGRTQNDWLDVDIPAREGCSGSPIIDLSTEAVVGMTIGAENQSSVTVSAPREDRVYESFRPRDGETVALQMPLILEQIQQ